MPQQSAGILLYRLQQSGPEVLLVHPGGPYFAKKDAGAWSIPKGLLDDKDENMLAAAKREFEEELGTPAPAERYRPLQSIKQKGGKIVHAWAAEGDLDVTHVRSNTFRMEYPYKSGRWMEVPEVDKAGWFTLEEAALKILPAQQSLLLDLAALLTEQ